VLAVRSTYLELPLAVFLSLEVEPSQIVAFK
jgi:hypothetical protein